MQTIVAERCPKIPFDVFFGIAAVLPQGVGEKPLLAYAKEKSTDHKNCPERETFNVATVDHERGRERMLCTPKRPKTQLILFQSCGLGLWQIHQLAVSVTCVMAAHRNQVIARSAWHGIIPRDIIPLFLFHRCRCLFTYTRGMNL